MSFQTLKMNLRMGRRRLPEWQTRQTILRCCSLQMKQVRELQVAEKKNN
jgi:hypothetical protein